MLVRQSRKKIFLVIYLPQPVKYLLHTEYISQYDVDIHVSSDKQSTLAFIKEHEVGALLMIQDKRQNDALSFLRYIMQQNPHIQRILLTEHVSSELMELVINKAHINYFLTLPVKPDKILEIVRKALKRYISVSKPEERIHDLVEYVQKFREQANTDPLTKLLNRRSFDSILQRAIELFRDKKIPFSLVLIDLDHFKILNDTYGHDAGDAVLQEFSRLLKKNVRYEDSVFRYGGEEFALVAQGDTGDDIKSFVGRILDQTRNLVVRYEDNEMEFTFSAGIAVMKKGMSKKQLIRHADAALYFAKGQGRNNVCVYRKQMKNQLK